MSFLGFRVIDDPTFAVRRRHHVNKTVAVPTAKHVAMFALVCHLIAVIAYVLGALLIAAALLLA